MKVAHFFMGLAFSVFVISADVIECDNGDRYNGKVLSMDEKKVVLQNDVTGTLSIPRPRIVSIAFREKSVAAVKPATTRTNAASFRPGAAVDANAVQKIRNDYLATATPEANQMFNEMVQGLASGKMNVADLQGKARETLAELRKLQAELGDDETAGLLDSYGAILEGFLRQPAGQPARPAVPTPTPAPSLEEAE